MVVLDVGGHDHVHPRRRARHRQRVPADLDPRARQPGSPARTAQQHGHRSAAASDGNPDNNAFTDAVLVSEPAIDLHVEKVVTSTPNFTPVGYLNFLDPITYRISVTNNGVADAANVQLAETFDAPLGLDSITPSQGSCAGTVCNLGTITPGQAPVTIDVQLSIANSFDTYPSAALLNNTATVSAPVGTETNPDDNSASAAISTVPWAETSITKTFSPAQPVAGGPITYTLTVHSDGPGRSTWSRPTSSRGAAEAPDGDIDLRRNRRLSVRADRGELRRSARPGVPIVFCDIPQFGPGEDRVITIQSTLAPDSAGTPVDNLAFSSNTLPVTGIFSFEPDLTNNADTVSFTPGTVDVGINKSVVGPSTVGVGDVATFRFAISNSGTVAATNVVVTDTLPDGLEALDLPPGCEAAGQVVTCTLATLPPASALTIDVNARADASAAGQTLTNRASIRSDEADLDAANDTSAADLTIGPLPTVDVGIEKTRAGSGDVPVGGEAVFRLVAPTTATPPAPVSR